MLHSKSVIARTGECNSVNIPGVEIAVGGAVSIFVLQLDLDIMIYCCIIFATFEINFNGSEICHLAIHVFSGSQLHLFGVAGP